MAHFGSVPCKGMPVVPVLHNANQDGGSSVDLQGGRMPASQRKMFHVNDEQNAFLSLSLLFFFFLNINLDKFNA